MRSKESNSLQDEVLDVFINNPMKEISNKYLIKNLENINVNTIYGSIARLKEANRIIWVRCGVHILNRDVVTTPDDKDTIALSEHDRILNKYIKLRNDVEEFIFHVSYNILKRLSVDMENVSNDDRAVIAQMILQTMEFTIGLELDEQEKQWLKDL